MQRYPDVARFVFEAGRIANARKDYAEARRLYDKADAAGYPMASNNIGGLYEDGTGGRADNAEAARRYRKAVDAGEPIAMVDLGYQYEKGHGIGQDLNEARRLYEQAVKAGVDAAYLWRLELGRIKDPSFAQICRVADALGITAEELRPDRQ